ncbi:MAG: hypothetical protein QW366_02495 [Sulfolobales archaeon]
MDKEMIPLESVLGFLLIMLGVLILLIGLLLYFSPEIRRILEIIPENIKPLIYISIKAGSIDIIISPALIILLLLIYIAIILRGV